MITPYPTTVEFIHLAINLGGLGGLLGAVWYLAGLANTVKEMKTNDLPHLEAEVKDLKVAIMGHLEWHAKK